MAAAAEEGVDIESNVLTEHVKFLDVSYWDPNEGQTGGWVDSWNGAQPPKAVLIRIGAEPLEEDADPMDYPYPTLWRVVSIPSGSALLTSGGGGGGRARGGRADGAERGPMP